MRVFHERLSVCECVCVSFPFDSEGGMWVIIVLVSDHWPSFSRTGSVRKIILSGRGL